MSSLRGDVLGGLDGLSAAFEFELGLFLGDLEDVDRVGDVLFRMIGHHLHPDLGVRISMDDFGTGYSSIGYLRSFPFDKIKIDQTFVRDVLVDEGSLAIVRAIAGLGVSFGMITTAEGVETEEQMRCLNLEGCIEVQGYLYSKPVPANEIAGLLDNLANRRL
jgi:EAL domain-containing protein (putative c-di-GMP-specific phosphodiesterase class I)